MIEGLGIKSFKSVRDSSLKLGKVNVFIGANGGLAATASPVPETETPVGAPRLDPDSSPPVACKPPHCRGFALGVRMKLCRPYAGVPLSLLVAAATGLLAACQVSEPSPSASPAGAAAAATIATPSKVVTRADGVYIYRAGEERLLASRRTLAPPALKADSYDDYRYFNPQRYAITVPPAIEGFRPMVEWEPMQSIVMVVPGDFTPYQNIIDTFVGVARWSVLATDVWILTDGTSAEKAILAGLRSAGVEEDVIESKVKVLMADVDSVWTVDFGPLPLVDPATQTMAFADFRYEHTRVRDDGVPTFLARQLPALGLADEAIVYRMPLTTEGGTFQSTSDGICFTGSRQLVYMSCYAGDCDINIEYLPLDQLQTHPFANEMRGVVQQYAGCKDLIITHSVTDDGTGHIDMYLKIVDDQTVAMGAYPEPFANESQKINGARMDGNAAFIEAYVKPDGTSFTAPRIEMPGHRSSSRGDVPFTYINSVFVNGGDGVKLNIWPAYEFQEWEPSRTRTQAKWQELMPDWDHIWVDSTQLAFFDGAIHCVTRTIPKLPPGVWVGDGQCSGDSCQAPEGAYDGLCRPNSLEEDICFGPAWECTCNYCETGCGYEPGGGTPCGDINYEGCCSGTTLRWCEGGGLDFAQCEDSCGWDADSGFYNCGFQGAEPSGQFPLSCDGCTPDCASKACGDDGCGGSCGTCVAGTACDGSQCIAACQSTCEASERGCKDGQAFTCQAGPDGCLLLIYEACGQGTTCAAGACVATTTDPADASGGSDVGNDAVATTGGGSGDGCRGGDGGGLPRLAGLLALALLAGGALRRRRGASPAA